MYVYILAQHYFNISTCFVSFSNTNTNIEAIYHLYLDVKMIELLIVFRCLSDGRRVGLRYSALSRHWLPRNSFVSGRNSQEEYFARMP